MARHNGLARIRTCEHSNRKKKTRQRALASLITAAAIIDFTPRAQATTSTFTWVGGVSTNWGDAGNWNPDTTSPNNGNDGISDFDAIINSVTSPDVAPILSGSVTLDDLSLGTGATLGIPGDNSVTFDIPTIEDDGTITVNSDDTSYTTLTLNGTTVSGDGTITLNGATNAAILTGSFTQASGHTISGYGEITTYQTKINPSITNDGTIEANNPNENLMILEINMTNNGVMEGNNGVLNLQGAIINQGPTGEIDSTNHEEVFMYGAQISGGTLVSSGSPGPYPNGIIVAGSSQTFSNVTSDANIYVVDAGNLTLSGTFTNNGSLTIGESLDSSNVSVGGSINGTGSISVQHGTLSFGSGLTIQSNSQDSVTLSNEGSIDMGINSLDINYGSNPDPISTIVGYLTSGYNGGNWNGSGIYSSTAHYATQYALGYADSADPGNPAGLATSGQLEIKYTLYGDANLDGTVNSVDFGILASNFGESGKSWDQGAFTYNGTVNSVDFGLLAANFGKSLSGNDVVTAADWAALDAFAAANGLMADVPEPVSGAFLGMATMGFLSRRRRA